MLEIVVPETEFFDDVKQEFYTVSAQTIQLEHSLISISKWESKWRKPFLANTGNRTVEESIDYIKCMALSRSVPPEAYLALTQENVDTVADYINQSQTATWFNEAPGVKKSSTSSQVVTSELIYYWMITYNIPAEYQKWPLSRLIALIRICETKSRPPQKMSKADVRAQMRKLNEQRRAEYGTRG